MIVDGEKYACDACIRGHRVSSCTHKDRKLNHVNKKGRPLTQCPHCRGLRKSRASHVKCECGEAGHSRNSSMESAANGGCSCQTGKRCVCALKKEPLDLIDIHKSTIPNPRRTAMKPGMSVHNSDSAVPRIKAPVPPLHRFHSQHHEVGQPYSITRPRPFGETLHKNQRSLDGSERGRLSTMSTQSADPSSMPMGQRQYCNLGDARYGSQSPRRRPGFPTLRVESQPMPDFSGSFDISTIHKAISPGNPARYSFHDMSHFTLEGLSRNTPEQDPYILQDEIRNANNRNWQMRNMHETMEERNNIPFPNPLTPSDVSLEFSNEFSNPSNMGSGTMSEAGDGTFQPHDFGHKDLPFRSMPLDATGNPPKPCNAESNYPPHNLHNWVPYMSQYPASDPGFAQNALSHLDNVGFDLDDLQGADAGPGPYVEQNFNQYDMNMPMMTDEGVRDWVQHPMQMQDPNLGYEMPPQYGMHAQSVPAMEGSYNGWL